MCLLTFSVPLTRFFNTRSTSLGLDSSRRSNAAWLMMSTRVTVLVLALAV